MVSKSPERVISFMPVPYTVIVCVPFASKAQLLKFAFNIANRNSASSYFLRKSRGVYSLPAAVPVSVVLSY